MTLQSARWERKTKTKLNWAQVTSYTTTEHQRDNKQVMFLINTKWKTGIEGLTSIPYIKKSGKSSNLKSIYRPDCSSIRTTISHTAKAAWEFCNYIIQTLKNNSSELKFLIGDLHSKVGQKKTEKIIWVTST